MDAAGLGSGDRRRSGGDAVYGGAAFSGTGAKGDELCASLTWQQGLATRDERWIGAEFWIDIEGLDIDLAAVVRRVGGFGKSPAPLHGPLNGRHQDLTAVRGHRQTSVGLDTQADEARDDDREFQRCVVGRLAFRESER